MSDQKAKGKQDKFANKSVRVSLPGRPGTRIMKAADVVAFTQMLSAERQWPTIVVLMKQITHQVPGYGPAWLSLFKALHEIGDFGALAKAATACLNKKPRFVPALVSLAVALRMRGRQDEALSLIEKAQKLAPGNPSVLNHLGIIQKELGREEAALVAFNRCIALGADECDVYWNRADLLCHPDDQDITEMKGVLKKSKLTPANQACVHYALAKAYEYRKEYDLQFEHIEQGARIKRESVRYDHDAEMARLASIPAYFPPEVLEQAGQSFQSQKQNASPVFICGLPRSGTTLVEQILSSHSEVTAGDELHDLPLATQQYLQKSVIDKPFPEWVKDMTPAGWQSIAERYNRSTERLQVTPFFTDKNLQNYQALGVIHLALPEAKMIYCRRDPMDTLWGCYRQLFGDGLYFTYSQRELVDTWKAANQVMDYWLSQFPEKIFVFDYDELIADQVGITEKLLAFVGLSWEPACVGFHLNSRPVRTLSSTQVRAPLNMHRQGQWQRFQSHLHILMEAMISNEHAET